MASTTSLTVNRLKLVATADASTTPALTDSLATAEPAARGKSFPKSKFGVEWLEADAGSFRPGDVVLQVIDDAQGTTVFAPQVVGDSVSTGRGRAFLPLYSAKAAAPASVSIDAIRAAVGDGRKARVGQWVENRQAISQVLAVFGLSAS